MEDFCSVWSLVMHLLRLLRHGRKNPVRSDILGSLS